MIAVGTPQTVAATGSAQIRHRTFCRLCPAMCGMLVTTKGSQVTQAIGDPAHPLSEGYSCPKGRSLPALHHAEDRLSRPEMGRGAERREVGWDHILDDLAGRIGLLTNTHGPDSVGLYLGTGIAFDAAGRKVAKRFLRAIGSASNYSSGSVDAPAKPLIADLVAGNAGLIPHTDPDTRLVVLIGVNPVVSHGHLNGYPNPRRRLRDLQAAGAVWVVDPRRTETARIATRHLAPRPGTDHVWLAALVRELLLTTDRATLDARADGVDRLQTAVQDYDLDTAARICDLDRADLVDLLGAIRKTGRIAIDSGTGATMTSAANTADWMRWALLIITDSLDQPGGMWFNPGFLHAFDDRRLVASDGRLQPGPPTLPGVATIAGEWPSATIPAEVESGNLRGLIVVGGNVAVSLPDAPRVAEALQRLEMLAVADVRRCDTTAAATHVLPVTGQLERADLPMFDTIYPAVAAQYTPAVVLPAADRAAAWWIFAQLAGRLGHDVISGLDPDTCDDDDVLSRLHRNPKATFQALQAADGAMVQPELPFGWVRHQVLPGGRWRIAPPALVRSMPTPAAAEGLQVIPRRSMRQLNSLFSDTGTADGGVERPVVKLNPDDALSAGLKDGATVRLRTASGELLATVAVDPDLRQGVVSVPHGFRDVNVNDLTSADAVDGITGMPRYAALPVQLNAAEA